MKKLALVLISGIFCGHFAFAGGTETVVNEADIQTYENEMVMPETELAPLATDMQIYKSSGGAVVGGIVGGIIGAIAADRWDRGDNHRRGRWATCYAQNRRGEVFRATARRAYSAQRQAMNKCLRFSRACRALGCR